MTPAEIAASLTKAQRESLLHVPTHQKHMAPPSVFLAEEGDVQRLHDLGLIARWHDSERSCWINGAGLAVRDILEEADDGNT